MHLTRIYYQMWNYVFTILSLKKHESHGGSFAQGQSSIQQLKN